MAIVEFRCDRCGTLLRAKEGTKVSCINCGHSYISSPAQPDGHYVTKTGDMIEYRLLVKGGRDEGHYVTETGKMIEFRCDRCGALLRTKEGTKVTCINCGHPYISSPAQPDGHYVTETGNMIEFRCDRCEALLRAKEGTKVTCINCGHSHISSLAQPDAHYVQPPVPTKHQPAAQPKRQKPAKPVQKQRSDPYQTQYLNEYPRYQPQPAQTQYQPQHPQQYQPQYQQQYPPPQAQQVQQQYTPQELAAAAKKRRGWLLMNIALYVLQMVLIGFGVELSERGYGWGTAMIIGWVFSIIGVAGVSAAMRPDEAYLTRKPLFPHRLVQFLASFLLGISTLFVGALIFVILSEIFG